MHAKFKRQRQIKFGCQAEKKNHNNNNNNNNK